MFKEEVAVEQETRYSEPVMVLVRGGSKPIELTKEALDYALELLSTGQVQNPREALHAAAGEYAHKGWFTPTPEAWSNAIQLVREPVTQAPVTEGSSMDTSDGNINDIVKSILRHSDIHKQEQSFSFDKEARVRYWTDAATPEQAEEDFQDAIIQAEKLLGLKIDVDNYRVGDP